MAKVIASCALPSSWPGRASPAAAPPKRSSAPAGSPWTASEVLDPARDVTEANTVTVDGRPVATESDQVVYAVNKPAGVVSTASDPQGRPTIISLVRSPLRLYPVGRLDIDTTGLILLTNNGDLAHRLLHPSFEVARTYRARVWKAPISQSAITALRLGVTLDDGLTLPAEVRRLRPGPARDHPARGAQATGQADVRARRPSGAQPRTGRLRAAAARHARPRGPAAGCPTPRSRSLTQPVTAAPLGRGKPADGRPGTASRPAGRSHPAARPSARAT